MNKQNIIKNLQGLGNKEKCNCYICQKHKEIAEEHFIVPLAEVKKVIYEKYEDETIFLCPNCHAYIHLRSSQKKNTLKEVYDYFEAEETRMRLAEILARYNYIKCKNERCEYANR